MVVVRNIQVQLDIQPADHELIDNTFDQFQHAAQYVANHGWNDNPTQITDTKTTLHDQTYDHLTNQLSLQTSLVQSARNLAANALGNCKDRILEDGKKASKPDFKGTVIVYNGRTITYNEKTVTLATTGGRVTAEYVIPEDTSGTPFEKYWTDEWEKTEATLHKKNGEYYLHIAVQKDEEPAFEETSENGVVLGVDLNVDGYLAVTSTGAFFGNADYLNHKRDEYEKRRGKLQAIGTRSAHLTIQSIGSRFSRWSEEYLHRVSKSVVSEAVENECTAIAVENLSDIRENMSNGAKFQQWAFGELQRQIKYKAAEFGIIVDDVPPRFTSQSCSKCGHTSESNRNGDEFACGECGYELHADYNAAKNIGLRLVRDWQKSSLGRATSQLALKSGVLSVSGEFSPTKQAN